LVKKNRIIVFFSLLLVLLLLLSGNLYLLFHQQNKTDIAGKDEAEDYQFKINALSGILAGEIDLIRDISRDIKINFFSSRKLHSPRQAASFMYDRLRKLSNSLGFELINFSPKKRILSSSFTKIPFSVEIEGNFQQIKKLFFGLEEEDGLIIDALKITNKSKSPNPDKLNCQFILNGIEVKDIYLNPADKKGGGKFSRASGIAAGLLLTDRWKERRKSLGQEIIRDPFSRSSSARDLAGRDSRSDTTSTDIFNGISFSGVISFPDYQVAIIEHEIVKEGDLVGGKRVISIEKDRVTLEEDNKLYFLNLVEEGL